MELPHILTIVVTVLVVQVTCSDNKNASDLDFRLIGIPVQIQTNLQEETSLFESILQAYANSDVRLHNIVGKLQNRTATVGISSNCWSDANLLVSSISVPTSPLNPVAMQYVDAATKLPYGVFQGKWNWVGDYQECNSIASARNPQTGKTFTGKYFSAAIYINGKPVLMNAYPLVMGICLPNSCNTTDARDLVNVLLITIKAEIAKVYPDIAKESILALLAMDGEPEKLDKGAKAVLCVFGVIVAVVFVATLIDYGCSMFEKENGKEVTKEDTTYADTSDRAGLLTGEIFATSVQEGKYNNLKQKLLNLCRAFSITSNGKKLFGTATAVGPLACLNGLRVLSMWWVILGHTYAFIFQFVDNIAEAAKIIQRFTFQPIMNGTYSVDSFFFLSGLLVAYLSLKEIKEKGRLSWVYYVCHRYWRLTPLYAFVILYYTFLYVYTVAGPNRFLAANPTAVKGIDACKTYWWTNLLYINNMYPNHGNLATTCLGWSWYLANDMQFYLVLGPIVIITLSLSGKLKYLIGFPVTVFLIIGCIIVRGVLVWYYGLYNEQSAPTKHIDDPWGKNGPLYGRPYARWSVYLIGMLTGYVLASTNNRFRIHKVVAVFGWCASIATALAVVYGQYYYYHHTGTHMTLVQNGFYTALSRPAWGLCLAWVVLACVSGNGGPVKEILSWKFWAPLGRLTYAAYLVHPIIIFTFYMNMLQPLHFSDLNMIYLFIANLVVSYVIAFVVSMLVEAPMIQLEKLMLGPLRLLGDKIVQGPYRWLCNKITNCRK